MKQWIFYALVSMVFAGFTSVIAKLGLNGISGEVGLLVRTVAVFGLVVLFAWVVVPMSDLSKLTASNYLWLGLSGLTTTISWIFYYKALKEGEVSTIALIDKGSIIVAVLLAWLLLKERITGQVLAGGALMLAGLWVIAKK